MAKKRYRRSSSSDSNSGSGSSEKSSSSRDSGGGSRDSGGGNRDGNSGSGSGGGGGSRRRRGGGGGRRRGGGGGGGRGGSKNSNYRRRDRAPREPVEIDDSELFESFGLLELHPNGYGFLRSPENNYSRDRSDPFVPGTMIEKYGLREGLIVRGKVQPCLLYTSPSPRDLSTSRMPSSA